MPVTELRPLPGEAMARGQRMATQMPEAVREGEAGVRPSRRDPRDAPGSDIGWLAQQIAQEVVPENEPEDRLSARASASYSQWDEGVRVLGPIRPFALTA